MGFREMDDGAVKNDPIETLRGSELASRAAFDRGSGLGETMRGAATAHTTSDSAASVTKPARAKNNDRFPQTGLIFSILTRFCSRDYSSLEGGQELR